MGKRGPAPKPTVLRVLHGTHPERVARGEPIPDLLPVEPPAALDAEALAIWQQLAPDLIRKGVLTHWDVHMFGIHCQAVAYLHRAEELANQSGVLLRGRNRSDAAGGVAATRNPALLVFRDMADLALRSGRLFGLTPSDRIQLATGEHDPLPGEHLLTQ